MGARGVRAMFVLALAGFVPGSAAGFPVLQLDISGGHYDTTTETIVASGQVFTLHAILTPKEDADALLGQKFYISAALVPKVGPGGQNLGSFTFAGKTVAATGEMTYGNPPIEAATDHDGGDLGPHSIFETFYAEFPFQFSSGNTAVAYNTQTNPGGLTLSSEGKAYYASFAVDTLLLNPAYTVHFDLYNEVVVAKKKDPAIDVDVDDFAPFSHDAQSPPPPPPPPVPEPGTWVLLAVAGGAAFARHRRQR